MLARVRKTGPYRKTWPWLSGSMTPGNGAIIRAAARLTNSGHSSRAAGFLISKIDLAGHVQHSPTGDCDAFPMVFAKQFAATL